MHPFPLGNVLIYDANQVRISVIAAAEPEAKLAAVPGAIVDQVG